ncbi:hypothetical protein HIM_12052 [Hirsutella minnesotensis 3608]|uniref:RNase H type-1 domain-containing protein n=1 Tax=Hirsutella minnesotensis 3608 TaxID=1043627 RepID=A0A0F7ZF56_9HYPO|nr:hypothetical protein HIM_12052 [Hirsutella minnesotensis 3608]
MIKLKHQKQPQPFRFRLRRTEELLPSCPRPALLQRGFAEEEAALLQNATKYETAKELRDWLQAPSPRTLVVYSNGSRLTEGRVGYGYAVLRDGSTVLSGSGRLGPAEVFDAEGQGALEGLKAALSLRDTDRVFVCLDNFATARCLRGTPSDYHERFDHHDARLTCSSGRRKDPTYIFHCRKVAPWHRMRLAPSPPEAIKRAIGIDLDKFVRLAKASSFFGGICPRH